MRLDWTAYFVPLPVLINTVNVFIFPTCCILQIEFVQQTGDDILVDTVFVIVLVAVYCIKVEKYNNGRYRYRFGRLIYFE